jgi:hypothetical protein
MTTTEIANMALGHVGVGREIADLDTENSAEAKACRRFFENTAKVAQRDFEWAFNKKVVTLGLVEEDPTDEWGYSYREPSDCLFIRRLINGARSLSADTRVPFEKAVDTSGGLIYTDMEDAVAEYTFYQDNLALWPDDFALAHSLLLAARIAKLVTGGDPFKLGDRAMAEYLSTSGRAKRATLNEKQPDPDLDPEWIRGRDS